MALSHFSPPLPLCVSVSLVVNFFDDHRDLAYSFFAISNTSSGW